MIRIDLFNPVQPSIYGTATARDIVHDSLAALDFALDVAGSIGGISIGITRLLQ